MTMDLTDIERLTGDPKFIPGIYNYCDRWCDRCRFDSRCLNRALTKEALEGIEESDKPFELFFSKFSEIIQQSLDLIKKTAEELGLDTDKLDNPDTNSEYKPLSEPPVAYLLMHASERYSEKVNDWFVTHAHIIIDREYEFCRIQTVAPGTNPVENADRLIDAIEVIRWYQFQINGKLKRALDSAYFEETLAIKELPTDSDGSAKVALIGLDRSIDAWCFLRNVLPTLESSLIRIIDSLKDIRRRVEIQFPNANSFIRPGFDEEETPGEGV